MKVLINPKNLVPNDSWQTFRKVRAVIENNKGCFAISSEAGKYIFPGGKCDITEDSLSAVQREIREETGMIFSKANFQEVLELETMYDNAVDYKTNEVRPRHAIMTYYYVKTNQSINKDNMNLTEGEIQENFKISFVDKETLLKMYVWDCNNRSEYNFSKSIKILCANQINSFIFFDLRYTNNVV